MINGGNKNVKSSREDKNRKYQSNAEKQHSSIKIELRHHIENNPHMQKVWKNSLHGILY